MVKSWENSGSLAVPATCRRCLDELPFGFVRSSRSLSDTSCAADLETADQLAPDEGSLGALASAKRVEQGTGLVVCGRNSLT
jgi:hypothetical protein